MKGQIRAMARVKEIADTSNHSIHEEQLKEIFGHVPTYYAEGKDTVSFHRDVAGWYWCKFNGHATKTTVRKVIWH